MADYYTQFSFIIPLTPEQTDEILEDLENTDTIKDVFDDPDSFSFCAEKDIDGLWVYCDECGSTNDAGSLLAYVIKKYKLPPMGFTWANFCSEPHLDAFGGGALWTNGETVDYVDTGNWLQERKEQGC